MIKKRSSIPRHKRTLCLPIDEVKYIEISDNPMQVRNWIDRCYKQIP